MQADVITKNGGQWLWVDGHFVLECYLGAESIIAIILSVFDLTSRK